MKTLALYAALGAAFTTSTQAAPAADDGGLAAVISVYMERGCPGCHQGEHAYESLAMFTTVGGEHELEKSLAYRHYRLRDRVVAAFGTKAFEWFPYLESPSIDPPHQTLEQVMNSLTRDGDGVTDDERAVFVRWFAAGAPLPDAVLDEAFQDVQRLMK